MTASSNTAYTHSSDGFRVNCRLDGGRRCGNWSGLNVTAMIIGFIVFWPLGLLIMFSNMSGRDVKDIPQGIRELWSRLNGAWNRGNFTHTEYSDNDVFNEFQQTQYDRIHEIKEEIKARSASFKKFRDDIKRRANEKEFNDFMADKPEDKNF